MKPQVWFMLEVGMRNPRDPDEIGWREVEGFKTLTEAKRAVQNWSIWRIVKCELVAFGEARPASVAS